MLLYPHPIAIPFINRGRNSLNSLRDLRIKSWGGFVSWMLPWKHKIPILIWFVSQFNSSFLLAILLSTLLSQFHAICDIYDSIYKIQDPKERPKMFQGSAESMWYNLAVHKIRSVDSLMETPFRKSLLGSLRVLWASSRQSALIGCEFRRNVLETTPRLAATKKRIVGTRLNKIGIFISDARDEPLRYV